MSSTWNNCLARLENEIPASDFSTWVRPLQAEETDEQIRLLAPNRFVLDWVKQHYFTKFQDAIYEFSNGQLSLLLEIGTKKTGSVPVAAVVKTKTVEVAAKNCPIFSTKRLVLSDLLKVIKPVSQSCRVAGGGKSR
jgi:chromosomal replication initiator protein